MAGPHNLPAASGAIDPAVLVRFDNANVVLDFGQAALGGNYGSWLQSRQAASLGNVGPILLNPNGGGVGVNAPQAIYGALHVRVFAENNTFFSNQGGFPTIGTINDAGSAWQDTLLHAAVAIKPLTDNAISMGNSVRRWNALWAVNGAIQTSDARAKTDIKDSALGLDFINTLRPVSYKWIVGRNKVDRVPSEASTDGTGYVDVVTPIPGIRDHYGLIAQDVAASVQAAGVTDFGGYVNPQWVDETNPVSDGSVDLGLRYDEFIAPIIKAVQELSAKVVALEAQVAALTPV
jgi:hypothetical protein